MSFRDGALLIEISSLTIGEDEFVPGECTRPLLSDRNISRFRESYSVLESLLKRIMLATVRTILMKILVSEWLRLSIDTEHENPGGVSWASGNNTFGGACYKYSLCQI